MRKKGPELIFQLRPRYLRFARCSDPPAGEFYVRTAYLSLLDVVLDGDIAFRFLVGRCLLSVCCAGDVFSVADGGAEQVAVDVLLVHFFPPDGISLYITKLKIC